MQLIDMTWPAIDALDRKTPVAALEQHGHHLPVFTDSMLLGEVVRRTSQAMHDQILFAPLFWLGTSQALPALPGTEAFICRFAKTLPAHSLTSSARQFLPDAVQQIINYFLGRSLDEA